MRVIREQFEIASELYSMDRDIERAPGCHLTDVIKYMATTKYKNREPDAVQAGFAGGFVLERVLAQHAIEAEVEQSRAGLCRIGAIVWCRQCDQVYATTEHLIRRNHAGIIATPDAVMIKEWLLKEFKFTKLSMRGAGADGVLVPNDDFGIGVADEVRENTRYEHISIAFWHWLVQIKGYCYLIGRMYDIPMLRAVIECLFVNGDYGVTTRDYSMQRYWFTFNERELAENWDAVVSHAIDGQLLGAHDV